MFDEKNDGLIGLIIGFGLGFIAAIIISKSKTDVQTAKQTTTETTQNEEVGSLLSSWRPLSSIPSVDRPGEFIPMPVVDMSIPAKNSNMLSTTHYKNSEKWKVKRDPNTGRIIGYDVDRDAKIG